MRKGILISMFAVMMFCTGCAELRRTGMEFATQEQENVQTIREVSIKLLKNWPVISGTIKGVIRHRTDELPKHVIDAMEELDALAAKYQGENPEYSDEDLGYAFGLRIHILCATIQEILNFYFPEFLKYMPIVS